MRCPNCQLGVPDDATTCPHCSADMAAPAAAAPDVSGARKRRLHDALTGYAFLLPNIVGFLTFTLLPVFAAFALSFFQWDVIQPFFPESANTASEKVSAVMHGEGKRHAKFVGLGNYKEFLGWERDKGTGKLRARDEKFWYYAYNTMFLMAGIPLGMCLSLILALLLNTNLKGVVIYRTVFFVPAICSPAAIALLWRWIYNPEYGLFNSAIISVSQLFGVTVEGPAWLSDPDWAKPALIIMGLWAGAGGYNCLLYLAGLQGIPIELYEAADIDGAGWWHRLRHITWPMLSPTTFFIFVMSIIAGFQGGFVYINLMTDGGPAGATTSLMYYIYLHAFRWFKMGRACSLAVLLFAVVFAITLINWRYGRRAVHYQ
jgi:multiple sugar transport system permease protein